MTTEHEFHRSHASQIVTHLDDDMAPTRMTKSSRLEAPAHPEPSGLLMRKAARDGNGVADGAEDLVSAASSGGGSALPMALMRKFESSLGTDLSSVRIHTGGDSAAAAHAVGARAYTIGQDIHFGAGQYDPSSAGGEHLLAHEVAHTVQQQGGTPTRQNKLEVSSPHDAAEHEADRAATAMVSGHSFAVTSGTGFQRKVFRDANSEAGQVDSKIWIDLPATKIKSTQRTYVTLDIAFKGKIGIQFSNADANGKAAAAPVTAGSVVNGKGSGVKSEVDLAKQEFMRSLLGLQFQEKVKEKFSFELSADQFKVAIGMESRVAWEKLPWLQGAFDASFIFASVKWAELQHNPDSIKVAAVESAIGIAGEGEFRGAKVTTTGQLVFTASPNWARIAEEAAERGASSGAKAAGATATTTAATATTTAATTGATDAALVSGMVETGAVATAAAAIILPVAVGAAMVAGGQQTEKNIVASRAAFAAGLKMRSEIDQYVSGYLDAIAGRAATGAGAREGNARIEAYMAGTGKSREQAGADLMAHNGGREKLKADLAGQLRNRLYAGAVKWFEATFADRFGLLEKCGETWGMRGVFRKDLYGLLFGDNGSIALASEPDSPGDDASAVASLAGAAPSEPDPPSGLSDVGSEPPEQVASIDDFQEGDDENAYADGETGEESGSDDYA